MTRRARALAALLVASAAVSACGDDDDDGSAPTTSVADTTTTEDPAAALEAEILDAYDAQWADFLRAGDPPSPDAEFLADHQTGQVLTGTRNVLRQYEAEGVAIRGRYETDAVVTEVTDTTAVVEDCGIDRTEVVRLDTGEVVEDSDDEPDGLVVELLLEEGSWKVASFERSDEVCSR